MKECPRCHMERLDDDEVMNCLSHRDDKTYICNPCGEQESMIDLGHIEPDQIEKEFIRTHTR